MPPDPDTAFIAPPKHRPGDQVFVRNGTKILLVTVSHAESCPVADPTDPSQAVWIWIYSLAGYGSGYLERQLTPAPVRLRGITWNYKGTNINVQSPKAGPAAM